MLIGSLARAGAADKKDSKGERHRLESRVIPRVACPFQALRILPAYRSALSLSLIHILGALWEKRFYERILPSLPTVVDASGQPDRIGVLDELIGRLQDSLAEE